MDLANHRVGSNLPFAPATATTLRAGCAKAWAVFVGRAHRACTIAASEFSLAVGDTRIFGRHLLPHIELNSSPKPEARMFRRSRVPTMLPSTAARVAACAVLAALLAARAADATPFAYVGSGTNFDVIDTATNMVVATVPLPTTCGGVAVSPDGSHVYLTCNSSRLVVLDTATNTATQSPPGTFTSNPSAVTVHPDGTLVYALDGPNLRVIDAATLTVVTSVFDPSFGATTMAINPAGTRLYVGGGNNSTLIVVDTTTNSVVTEIGGLAWTYFTAITPDGSKVYTGRLQGFPIHVIDTATNTVIGNIPIPQGVAGLAVNPAGTRLYNVEAGSSALQVIDTATDTVLTTVPLVDGCGGIFPSGLAMNPAGTHAYFYGNGGCDGIAMRDFDLASNTIVAAIPVPSLITPQGAFIGPFCPGACSDGNPCTTDHCNPISGACTYSFNTGPCASDGIDCTDDVCDGAGTCTHPNSAPGSPCNDGTFCNGPDTCDGAGGCNNHAGDPCAGGPACAQTCNEAAGNCFDPPATPCTSDGNVCTDDVCDGSGTCQHLNNTAPCDDGHFCNGADHCLNGGCMVHAGDPCAGGPECQNMCNDNSSSCDSPAGTLCTDDGNLCTADQCNGTGVCTHPAQITTGCRQPVASAKSSLLIRENANPARDGLSWAWTGAATALSDFGDPLNTTNYAICVYDETAGPETATLKARADAPAGGICHGKLCWKETKLGFIYRDSDRTPDGLSSILLKPGAAGKARVSVIGNGTNLTLSPLPYTPKVTVQLKASNGQCWDAGFVTPTKDDTTLLRAKSE